MIFMYVNLIWEYGESSYSGGSSTYHEQMRRLSFIKASHLNQNRVPHEPRSFSITPSVRSIIDLARL